MWLFGFLLIVIVCAAKCTEADISVEAAFQASSFWTVASKPNSPVSVARTVHSKHSILFRYVTVFIIEIYTCFTAPQPCATGVIAGSVSELNRAPKLPIVIVLRLCDLPSSAAPHMRWSLWFRTVSLNSREHHRQTLLRTTLSPRKIIGATTGTGSAGEEQRNLHRKPLHTSCCVRIEEASNMLRFIGI
uniref:Secreted protein n=1 Tax=Anopheles culicifacies TaxID=139723 RepID=A0A182LTP5_9DIPT